MDRTISTQDAAACVALVDECCELWADASLWQDHLTSGAERLIGGVVCAWAISAVGPRGPLMIEGHIPRATDSRLTAQWSRYVKEGGVALLPEAAAITPSIVRDGRITYQQVDVIDRRTFYASDFYERYWAQDKIDNGLAAIRVIQGGLAFGLAVHRRSGDRSFGDRDFAIIDLLSLLLSHRIGRPLLTRASLGVHRLARRQREVLAGLLDGSSEKQIAYLLGISRATTHEYVAALYKHFGVHSKGQLMAWFLKRGPPLFGLSPLNKAAVDLRVESPHQPAGD